MKYLNKSFSVRAGSDKMTDEEWEAVFNPGVTDEELMEAKSSLEYWEKRWAGAPWDFATSWPDTYARRLELAALKKYLSFDKGPILELGCGNLQIAEDNDLLLSVAKAGYGTAA